MESFHQVPPLRDWEPTEKGAGIVSELEEWRTPGEHVTLNQLSRVHMDL